MPLVRVKPGQTVLAEHVNALQREVEAARRLVSDGSVEVGRHSGGTAVSLRVTQDGFLFKNSGSYTVPPYGLVRVTGINIADSEDPAIDTNRASTTFSRIYLANSGEEVLANRYGILQRGPVVTLAYDTGTPAYGDGYGPKDGQFTASKNYPACATCLGIVDSTNKWMLAQLQPINTLIGKLTGALSEGGTTTVNVWSGDAGSEAVVTSMTVDASDWLSKPGSGSVGTSGTKVVCQWINGQWYVTEVSCD